jgi:NTP pyrophosphatase (non-canonical NTP hydrolase)
MDIEEHASWLKDFYQRRGWYDYPPMERMVFLTEELGELAQVVRAREIGRDHPHDDIDLEGDVQGHIREEIADVLDNLVILAEKYDISPSALMEASESKLSQRFARTPGSSAKV